jgi:hypothetical protein
MKKEPLLEITEMAAETRHRAAAEQFGPETGFPARPVVLPTHGNRRSRLGLSLSLRIGRRK